MPVYCGSSGAESREISGRLNTRRMSAVSNENYSEPSLKAPVNGFGLLPSFFFNFVPSL